MTPKTNFELEAQARLCIKKWYYPTLRDAKKAAQRMQRERGSSTHPYRCPFCSKWHLTSTHKKDTNL